VWALHVVVVTVSRVETNQLQADELASQAKESLLASAQAIITLQDPTLGVVILTGVKAHRPSDPPPLQASLLVYEKHRVLPIQLVPLETHPAPVRATEHKALVVSMKSSHTFNLHAKVPVLYPTGKAKIHNPSVPSKHPASTVYETQV